MSRELKMIGLLGGMSWESTLLYYRLINKHIAERLGGLHSARIILYSVDFQEIDVLQRAGQWKYAGDLLSGAATALEKAGAECIVLCTNTMHMVAGDIQASVRIPLLHIVDATAASIINSGIAKVGLLGTRFTMEQAFYRDRLAHHGLDVHIPHETDRIFMHRVIYDELCMGIIRDESRRECERIISDLVANGVEGVILGCTEIQMLLCGTNTDIPLFDTTAIHARLTADWACDTT